MSAMSFFYFSVCHVCKIESATLKKCSKCKLVHYCSQEHQRQDWQAHKDLCKVITDTSTRFRFTGRSPTAFNRFKIVTGVLWHFELGRDLSVSEHEMWMYPKVCAVCYKGLVNIVCTKCWSVVYCSETHRMLHETQHKEFCSKLKLCLKIHQVMFSEEREWERLSFDFDDSVLELPDNICDVVRMIKFKNDVDYWKKALDLILMTEFFCSAVNVVYALETCKFVERRIAIKTKLVIHTTTTEISENTSWGVLMEFLSHWIYNLEGVKIYVVSTALHKERRLSFSLNCGACREKRFNSSVMFIKAEYHEVVGKIPCPDLIVMFNPCLPDVGLVEWSETVPKLLAYQNAPIILTSYTMEELQKSVGKFPPPWIKSYVKPQENLYSSLRPVRNSEEGSDPVIYRNNFVSIIAKN
ncbi:uncharacterized protein LOC135133480 [Zophobas morio]|uniref:uncharacterized protein LOC135133480 n=1 Tax=Zophobas morio TaxID=2755281 RepID=UPI003082862C